MRLLSTVLLFLLAAHVSSQEITTGDDLKKAVNALSPRFYGAAPRMEGNWLEGKNMILISDKENARAGKYIFIALSDTSHVGLRQNYEPYYFITDTDADGKLDTRSPMLMLPLWAVKNERRTSAADKAVFDLLEQFNKNFLEADDLVESPELGLQMGRMQADTTMNNRHLLLAFENYQNLITATAAKGRPAFPDLQVQLAKQMSAEFMKVYKTQPAIIYIYTGEAYLTASMEKEAREHFKAALKVYPGSVPLQVYNYRLEQDTERRKVLLAELKKKYPNHWMVKDL